MDSGLHDLAQTDGPDTSSQPPTEKDGGQKRTSSKSMSSDFDTLPELASLKETPEFQYLSQKSLSQIKRQSQKVKLIFSGLSVKVVLEENGEELLKKRIRTIACCAHVCKFFSYLLVSLPSLLVLLKLPTPRERKKENIWGSLPRKGPGIPKSTTCTSSCQRAPKWCVGLSLSIIGSCFHHFHHCLHLPPHTYRLLWCWNHSSLPLYMLSP